MVHTADGCCSVGVQADEIMRVKFLFCLNDSFRCFREDIYQGRGAKKALGSLVHLNLPDQPGSTL